MAIVVAGQGRLKVHPAGEVSRIHDTAWVFSDVVEKLCKESGVSMKAGLKKIRLHAIVIGFLIGPLFG